MYNFTSDIRETLARAREEAGRLGHRYVGTEHLALAVLRYRPGVVATAIAALDRATVVTALEQRAGRREDRHLTDANLPYTSQAKRILELAMHEASALGHDAVGSEHLLVGLLRDGGGAGGRVLREAGLEIDTVRATVRRERGTHAAPRSHKRPAGLLRRILAWAGLAPRA